MGRLSSIIGSRFVDHGRLGILTPLTTYLIFVLLVFVLCLIRPNASRIFLGFYFLAMAIRVDVITVLAAPVSYIDMGRQALIPFYRWSFENLVALNPASFVLPIAAFQIAIALMMLHKGRAVRLGLAGCLIFLVAVSPLGVESLPNLLLALAVALLLRWDFDRTYWRWLGLSFSQADPGRHFASR